MLPIHNVAEVDSSTTIIRIGRFLTAKHGTLIGCEKAQMFWLHSSKLRTMVIPVSQTALFIIRIADHSMYPFATLNVLVKPWFAAIKMCEW